MLPDVLSGSYQRYKADTNTFTTWLSKAAIAVGYKIPEKAPLPEAAPTPTPKSKRLKGKARKQSKAEPKEKPVAIKTPAVKYTLTTKDILDQAQIVAGRVEVPVGLTSVLRRAIQARQRCAEWFRATKIENQYSNEGHQHFIGVLEQTLAIIDKGKTQNNKDGKTETNKVNGADKASWQELTNRFQHLTFEELPDIEEPEITEVTEVFELEEESEEVRMSLMIFYFFEDLHRIQDFLHEVWKGYKVKEVNLMTASLVTNAAIELVRQNEKEIVKAAPEIFNEKRSYDTIAIVIFYAHAFQHGQDPDAKLATNIALEPTPFDDFIYLSTARILMKFDYISTLPNGVSYPLPTFPMRLAFVSRPELLGTPYMNKKEKEDELLSQLIIDLDLKDTMDKGVREGGMLKEPPPAEDELSYGLRKLREKGAINVWMVFAARVFLDLHDILGKDIKKGRDDRKAIAGNIDAGLTSTGIFSHTGEAILWLNKEMGPVKKLIEASFSVSDFGFPAFRRMSYKQQDFGELDSVDPGKSVNLDWDEDRFTRMLSEIPTRNTESKKLKAFKAETITTTRQAQLNGVNLPQAPKFSNMSSTMIRIPKGYDGPLDQATMNRFVRTQLGVEDEPPTEEHEENARKLNIKPIKPNPDDEFIITHNPVYCGTVALGMVVMKEHAGLLLNNYHVVTTLVAHLYTEARRTGLLKETWKEMDQMISMHEDIMFAGKLPESANEAYIRYQKLLGISPTTRMNRHQRGLPYKEPQYKPLPLSDSLFPFFDNKATLNSTVGQLEILLQSERERVHHETKHKRRNARRKLTPLQFLEQLKDFLPTQMSNLQFDYITLTKTCYVLLKQTRAEIKSQLKIEHQNLIFDPEESIKPTYPLMVLKILGEAKEVQGLARLRDEAVRQSPQMEVVARCLKTHLATRARASFY